MADITLCTNKLCPLAGNCKRILAIPSDWQSYALFQYRITFNGAECDHYWTVAVTVKTTNQGIK